MVPPTELIRKSTLCASLAEQQAQYDPATNRIVDAATDYDANGNLVQLPGMQMKYDANNRLVRLDTLTGAERFGYDHRNLRVWTLAADGTESFSFYQGTRNLASYALATDASGDLSFSVVKTNIYFGERLAQSGGDVVVKDRLGSSRAWSAKQGAKTASYLPFGEKVQGQDDERSQFQGYEEDVASGLKYAEQRYYSSTLGRFMSPDPYEKSAHLANPESWNRYLFVSNDPINKTDPHGLNSSGNNGNNGGGGSYGGSYGKLPYDHLALTQQSACNYGQGWPMLVYLPTCAFFDSTIQHTLGLLDYDRDRTYWAEVTPHEVAHQWWGQLVGFSSYRDQWMSEGFATFSAGLFLLNTNPKMDQYRNYWNEQKKNLLQKNKMGLRPIDVGPLTMGYRVANEKTGNIYQLLIYSKGAYVLHMLETMYYTPATGDAAFKRSMHQFVAGYAGKAATTEDWKASMEKTMPKLLDLAGDGKLDWFFNEYVYGTELPHYAISSEFSVADGVTSVHIKLAQSNVSKDFRMLVPIYLTMENGNTILMGKMPMHGVDSIDETIPVGKLPAPAKTLVLNYNADVLSDN